MQYEQPTYEIIFDDPADGVRAGSIPYQHAAFVLSSDQGYVFRFAGPEYLQEREQLRAALFDALEDDETDYPGTLSRPFTGSGATEEFTMRFDSFDRDDGEVEARVSFGQDRHPLTGHLIGLRTLLLRDDDGAVWDLRILDPMFVSGTRETADGRENVFVDLNRAEEQDGGL